MLKGTVVSAEVILPFTTLNSAQKAALPLVNSVKYIWAFNFLYTIGH